MPSRLAVIDVDPDSADPSQRVPIDGAIWGRYYVEHVRRLYKARIIKAPALVYGILAARADANAEAWPSIEQLAADTSLSDKTVRRALRALQDLGLVTIVAPRNRRGREHNLYALDVPKSTSGLPVNMVTGKTKPISGHKRAENDIFSGHAQAQNGPVTDHMKRPYDVDAREKENHEGPIYQPRGVEPDRTLDGKGLERDDRQQRLVSVLQRLDSQKRLQRSVDDETKSFARKFRAADQLERAISWLTFALADPKVQTPAGLAFSMAERGEVAPKPPPESPKRIAHFNSSAEIEADMRRERDARTPERQAELDAIMEGLRKKCGADAPIAQVA
ncbi:MAG TPA: helix-turn-helix domain-containing protein [Candidatus Cybelea sp.]